MPKKKPIYTSDPNDPRIQAYSDSLNVYNASKQFDHLMPGTDIGPKLHETILKYKASIPSSIEPIVQHHFTVTKPNVMGDKIDSVYLPKFYDKPTQPVKYADPKIVEKQKKLKDAGLYDGPLDGIWGKNSKKAWKKLNATEQVTEVPPHKLPKSDWTGSVHQPKGARSEYTPKEIEENIDDLNTIYEYGEKTKKAFTTKIKALIDKGDIEGARKLRAKNFEELNSDPKMTAAYKRLEAKGLLPQSVVNNELGNDFQYATFKKYELPKKEVPQEKPLRKYIRWTPDTPGVGKYFLYDEDRGIKGKPLTEAQVNSNAYIMYPQMKTSYKKKAMGGEIYPTNSALENISVDQISKGTSGTGEMSTFNQLQGIETAQSKIQKQNTMNNMTPEMLAAYQQMMAQQQAYGGPVQYNLGGQIGAGLAGVGKGIAGSLLPGPLGGMATQGIDALHGALDKNITDEERAIMGYGQAAGAIGTAVATGGSSLAQGADDIAQGVGQGLTHGTGEWGKENAGAIGAISNVAGMAGGMAGGNLSKAPVGQAAYDADYLKAMQAGASSFAQGGLLPNTSVPGGGIGLESPTGLTDQQMMNQNYMNAVGMQSSYGGMIPQYAMGGQLPPNGGIAEINAGGTHEQNPLGGVPMGENASVEQGEAVANIDQSNPANVDPTASAEDQDISKFVFSDRIKTGKGKETFADAAKKVKRKYKTGKDEDRYGDAAAMKAQNQELKALAQEQEDKKAEEILSLQNKIQELGGGSPAMAAPPQMPAPEQMPQGMAPGMEQGMPQEAPMMDPSMMAPGMAYGGKIPYNIGGFVQGMQNKRAYNKEYDEIMNPYGFDTPQERNLKIGAGQLANSAGDIYNLVQGLRGTDPISFDRYTPEDVNLTEQRRQIERDNALADAMMRKNLRSNNAAAYYSNLVAGTAANQKARGDQRAQSYMTEDLKNTEIANAAELQNLQIARQELQANLQAEAKAKEAIQQGLHGIGANAATGIKDIRQSEADDRFYKMAAANMGSKDFKMDPVMWNIIYNQSKSKSGKVK